MNGSIVIQQPAEQAQQLFLLYHGVGSTPHGLVSLGAQIANSFPHSLVVSAQAAHACDLGQGYQWFSVRNITEENRAARVAQAMPVFIESIQYWQNVAQLPATSTAVIGFSQGAIMALCSTQLRQLHAARIMSISGRFARTPEALHPEATAHFIHGKTDSVIHYGHTVQAAQRLVALGSDVTADVLPMVGHEINQEIEALVLKRLQTYLPKRLWDAARQNAAQQESAEQTKL